jgi:hypothetical protein
MPSVLPKCYNRLYQARERSSSAWRAVAVSSPNLALERQARAKTVLTRCNSFVTNFQTQFRRNLAVYYVISLCIAQ